MNYLDLTNKILVEMNFKSVTTFEELVKQDHIKIKDLLSRVNKEICNNYDWNFLLRDCTINIPKNTTKITNKIKGRIDSFVVDGVNYRFDPNYRKFLLGVNQPYTFSAFNKDLLVPKFNENKEVFVTFYTNNCVLDTDGNERDYFKFETDESLIPDPYCEMVLVYGTSMRFKSNPSHVKFKYWYSMYNDSLAALRSKCVFSSYEQPFISLN